MGMWVLIHVLRAVVLCISLGAKVSYSRLIHMMVLLSKILCSEEFCGIIWVIPAEKLYKS